MSDTPHCHVVRVKNGAGWRKFSCLRLMISVGKPYHEGTKLQAVVDWINRNPSVEKVQVSVNDLLQRHNLIAWGSDADQAAFIAENSGLAWIKRNEEILSGIRTDWSFTRWNDWYGTEKYEHAHKAILQLEKDDLDFHKALEIDSTSLAHRKELRGDFVPEDLVSCSYTYVTEELAIFALQSHALPAAEVYPGTSLHSVKYLFGRNLPEPLTSLSTRHVTRIDFERRKLQIQPSPIHNKQVKIHAPSKQSKNKVA